ncbi:unnamed protein product [Paramecium pentaurelia]|uniref:Uncharacterized protein n=1 Tax=Paramecium pentaurelia TaxID=43138 RepID=A0A8S1UPA5_9CILI|nr:unnamed protein product [Paramecium pentaurelia]
MLLVLEDHMCFLVQQLFFVNECQYLQPHLVLCLISLFLESFKLMIIGIFIKGIFESRRCVTESYYINKWFKDKENSSANGQLFINKYRIDTETALCRIG